MPRLHRTISRTAPPRRFVPPNNPDPSVVYESLGVDPVLADFYGAIHGIDEQLGELRSLLQSMDLEDNTILVVFGDNGSTLTILSAFGQGSPTCGTTTESIAVSPGYADFINPAGLRSWKGGSTTEATVCSCSCAGRMGESPAKNVQQIDALTHVSDLFPTLLDLAGIEIEMELEESLDGISLESLLSGTPDDAFDERTVPFQVDLRH